MRPTGLEAVREDGGSRADRGAALLVVDDNEDNRDLLSRRLVAAGFAVAAVSSGPEALAALSEGRFDLVLLDVMMPEMDGLEVLRRIRARFGVTELPVVMASALGESRDLVEALRLGANDYVTKPLDMQVVLARVGTQLALRRASEEVTRLAAQLKAAQERISTLLATGGEAFLDFGRWARSMAMTSVRTRTSRLKRAFRLCGVCSSRSWPFGISPPTW